MIKDFNILKVEMGLMSLLIVSIMHWKWEWFPLKTYVIDGNVAESLCLALCVLMKIVRKDSCFPYLLH